MDHTKNNEFICSGLLCIGACRSPWPPTTRRAAEPAVTESQPLPGIETSLCQVLRLAFARY
jgi:hypothetical protein